MLSKQIDRYIIREVLSPTLLCLVIFTMVMVLGRAVKLVDLIINKGVSLPDILILLATLLPTFFSISLPLAFLMGIMIGLGRMSADSEIVALKSAGVGLARISIPVFSLAVIFALLTGATNIWVKPWGYRAFATKSFEIVRQKAVIGFQPRVFMSQFNDLVLYANDIDDRTDQMHGLFIVEKKPESTSWVFADKGDILTDEKSQTVTIRLHDGVIHRQQAESASNYQLIHFRSYDVRPEIAAVNGPATRKHFKPKELPTSKLWSHISSEAEPARRQDLQAELHLRLTSPLAPLLFVLFGLPFSVQSHRSGRSGGFVMGLIIFLGYYFILSTALTLTEDAAAPPWLTFWTIHLLLTCVGALFLRQCSQEKPNQLVSWFDQALLTLQKRARKNVDS
ncbi:MAG: LPS export ABC transporter permease LptF [Desulfuromonadales bacterium]|nr:LPS export ABC transporter permease LptF [Desulfuromonadales bacterium]